MIPVSMRLDVLDELHEGHQGITKCRERAKASVWWPGLSKQLEELVNNCSTCIKERVNRLIGTTRSPLAETCLRII